jgi:hypothetical protein
MVMAAGGAERGTAPGAVTGAGTAWPRRLAAVLRPIVSARTWLAVIHLLAGFFLGIISFTLLVTGVAAGIALLPIFLSGVPVLIAVRWLCGQFCRGERARFAVLLDVQISGPPPRPDGGSWRRRAWRAVTSPSAYREFGYALLRFPLSVLQVVVLIVGWALPAALLTLPAYNRALPQGGAHLGGYTVHGPAALTAAAVAGIVLLPRRGGAGSSVTCMTALSSGWSPWPWNLAGPGPSSGPIRRQLKSSSARRTSRPRRR